MSHLRRFRTLSEYETFRNSDEWVTPNVSAINDIDAIMYNPYEKNNYLRFTAIEDSTLSLNNNGDNTPNVEYSFDGINDWTAWDYSEINLPAGTTVYMRGNNPNGFSGFKPLGLGYKYNNFGMTGKIESHGNVMSLLYGDDFKNKLTIPVGNCFSCLFYGCSSLTTAPELPATTLYYQCYREMFYGCTSLTTAPKLPATKLSNDCYNKMFSGCSSLTTVPELPATILSERCYQQMFNGCSSLTSAPSILPAMTLARSCYSYMFYGCSSLTTAPELPATTLAHSCYEYMFYGCTSLTTAPELPATKLSDWCCSDMFNGCTSLTTAPSILPATTLADNCYYRMFQGCSSLTTAPDLPATTLAESCYQRMFYGCKSLNSITMLATDISALGCLGGWVNSVSSTGTFTKASSMTSLPSGESGIPEGWTVENA